MLTTGGSVKFTANATNNASVLLQSGASINVAGGYVTYLPGYVPTTRLLGSDGRIYDISQAQPTITYLGIYGQFTDDHTHWNASGNESETFLGGSSQVYQPGYSEGHDAGGISINTTIAQISANLQFGSLIGSRQAALGESPAATTRIIDAVTVPTQSSGDQLPSQGYLSLTLPQSVIITDGAVDYSNAAFQPDTPKPTATKTQQYSPVQLSARQLSSYGLSSLSIVANDLYIPAGASLNLATGGHFSADTAGAIDIEGGIVARGGQINLKTDHWGITHSGAADDTSFLGSKISSQQSDIIVGGTLDTSGRWVNDTGLTRDSLAGPGFINGGAISLQTDDENIKGSTGITIGCDCGTGNIILDASSVLDASSGGYINPEGRLHWRSPV